MDGGDGVLRRCLAPHGGDGLLVADGLHGRAVGRYAGGQQRAHLVEQALAHHGVHAPVDAVVEILPVGEIERDLRRVVPRRHGAGLGVVLRDGLAREDVNLHGAHDALLVRGVEPGRPLGVDLAQLAEQALAADLVIALAQLLPQRGVGCAVGERAPGDERVDVQPRTADDDRQFSPRENIVHAGGRLRRIARDGVIFRGVGDVDHMVRHALHLFRRWLGRADVHAAVDLHRVGRDDLAAQALRERHAERGLARGGRAGDDDNFWLHRGSLLSVRENSKRLC